MYWLRKENVSGQTNVLAYYDLNLIRNNVSIQPSGKIIVTLPAVEGDYDNIVVVYIDDDGSIEKCKTTVNADGSISFETDHFSKYAVIGVNEGLTVGVVAGIVLASILLLGLGGFALFWFVIKKNTWTQLLEIFKKEKDQDASGVKSEDIQENSENDSEKVQEESVDNSQELQKESEHLEEIQEESGDSDDNKE